MLKVKFMNITIQRTRTSNTYAHGLLSIDGARICQTLENANGQVPAGVYPFTLIKCKQYVRKMPCLNPTPPCYLCKKLPFVCSNSTLPCYCPMIKPGNGVDNRLDGSILVGQSHCPVLIIHPKTTFNPLYERIRKSVSRGNEVLLTIVDPDSPSTLDYHP